MDEDDELDDWKETRGRKPSPFPMFLKKFRGTEEEQQEFLELLPGDAREDFVQLQTLLKTDYMLTGHKCKPIARMKMGEGRDWWLGELLEPIPDWPGETHCLHIKTPLKEVVLGINQGDLEQLAVLCQVVCGPINPNWLERMAIIFQKRAQG